MVGIAKNTLEMNYDTDGRHGNYIYIALRLVLQSFSIEGLRENTEYVI